MKYSVIIPAYNKANTISKAIDSIKKQTITDYEIIVINDGSSDNTEDILAQYKDSIIVINQNNQGVSIARNNGIKRAKGKYICFLDADDIWLPNHLETLEKLICLFPECVYYATSHEIINKNGKVINSSVYLDKISHDDCFIIKNLFEMLNKYSDNIVHTNSMCISKEILISNNLFFEEGIKIGEDTDLWYRISLKYHLAITKKTTTLYCREFSDATKYTSNVYDWIFSRRIQNIIQNDSIKDEIKIECIKLIDRYYLNCSRCYMLENKRKRAKEMLDKVNNKKGMTYVLTYIYALLPYSFCKKIYKAS